MPLATILHQAQHQGHPTDQWHAFKRYVRIRVPRILPPHCFLTVPEWNWRDYLSGSGRA